MEKITVHSTDQTEIIDITRKVQTIVDESGVKNGLCLIFVPHTISYLSLTTRIKFFLLFYFTIYFFKYL